jgi:glycosyltransferase involved in cell wall biosynthesis
MEALACGTPVIAYRSGALPEIIEQGVTGFIVNDQREMADAVRAVGELDPEACRQAARTRFSLNAMVQKYFEAYEQLATSAPPPDVQLGEIHAAIH